MQYQKIFSPNEIQSFRHDFSDVLNRPNDSRDGEVYVYDTKDLIVLAVNVALATGRPLLVFGPAGAGKSSLAANIARTLKRRYYDAVVTSRTQAQDLLWRFDAIRRLADAQSHSLENGMSKDRVAQTARYIEPGVLWWAFDPESAGRRGFDGPEVVFPTIPDPSNQKGESAVVLIDEIDKADPDVPNNLLVPVGSSTFFVPEIGVTVQAKFPPLIVITSNGERDLPSAFLRRCVSIHLPEPDADRLVAVADTHFGTEYRDLYRLLADKTVALAKEYNQEGLRPPSAAEFLDAVRACLKLGIVSGSLAFEHLLRFSLEKSEDGRRR